jgi:hypothetical protein
VQAETMFWRRLDQPGHEAARLVFHPPFWQLTGTAVFADRGVPCRVEYQVTCDPTWQTLAAQLSGWAGARRVVCSISADPRRRWRLDGREYPAVEGCVDLDLSFSPATNLIPVRRLGLAVGDGAPVRAAWLRFPECRLEPLEQRYHRVDAERYRYESGTGDDVFRAELRVTSSGFVVEYPGFWSRESAGMIG